MELTKTSADGQSEIWLINFYKNFRKIVDIFNMSRYNNSCVAGKR